MVTVLHATAAIFPTAPQSTQSLTGALAGRRPQRSCFIFAVTESVIEKFSIRIPTARYLLHNVKEPTPANSFPLLTHVAEHGLVGFRSLDDDRLWFDQMLTRGGV